MTLLTKSHSNSNGDSENYDVEGKRSFDLAVIDQSQLQDLSEADRKLAQLGYQHVLKREFSMFSAFSFAVSISGLFATVATTFSYPLAAGGAAATVWCWVISGAGCMCIALSVAELVSAYPTSGGLYFTCGLVSPEKYAPLITWMDGWINLLGQIAGIASTDYGAAQLLLAAVSIGSDFQYVPTQGQTVAVMAAILVFHGMINSLSTKALEKFTSTYVIFHVAILISACVALLVMQKDKHSAEYVFTNIESSSGWNPLGFSFLFGFLSVSWTMTDYDATAHICEEMTEPERKAPWAISMAMGFTYVAGILLNIVLAFCMGDPTEILNSPIAQPVSQIFYNVMGKAGGIFFTVAAFIIMSFVGITATHSCSRTVWAFSRDKLLPFSNFWYQINPWTQTPLYTVWLTVISCILINLIALGSYITISAIFNICAIALDWSYCIPIICKLVFNRFEPGPWHMGRFSVWVNLWAVCWTAFVSVIFIFPTAMPVVPDNMNYAIVFFVAIILFAWVYWQFAGKNFYHGPRANTQLIDGTNQEDVSVTPY
jgi:amino acid permease (GABA permease)